MIFKIEKEIFEHFPGLKIVTAVVENMRSSADEKGITEYLNEAWKIACSEGTAHGNPQSHPNIVPWVQGMKNLGVSRKKFPSSIEAMVKRATKSDEPFRISPVVDFYNAVSLANMVPAGGYDIDEIEDVIRLRMSEAGDTFCALDGSEEEPVPEGEVSYADGHKIITRHFIWKQSKHCLLTDKTRNILFVSEILPELPSDTANSIAACFKEGLNKYFGVDAKIEILSEDKAWL